MRANGREPATPAIATIDRDWFLAGLVDRAADERVPVRATVEITYGCNLRCVHCFNPTHQAEEEMTSEQLYRVIDELADEGTFEIIFTGGELFTRRDCFEIVAYAKQKGTSIVLLTNATMITEKVADQIRAIGPRLVEVSIYGATAGTYEKVTRIPGSFQRFVRGVELLRERQVPLLVKMPVMSLNHHEVRGARDLVQGWGVHFAYSTEIHSRVDGSQEPLEYRLPPADVPRVDEELLGHRRWAAGGGSEEAGGCGAGDGIFSCECGKSNLAVTPYGKMNLCVSLPIPEYDLARGSVASGWSTLVNLVDSSLPSEAYECDRCGLEPHCRQGPMNAWLETGDLNSCLPYFKELATLERRTCESSSRTAGPSVGQVRGSLRGDGGIEPSVAADSQSAKERGSRLSLRYLAGWFLISLGRALRKAAEPILRLSLLPERFAAIVWTSKEIGWHSHARWNAWEEVRMYSGLDDWLDPHEKALVGTYFTGGGEVLNLACGAGREALLLARRGFAVTGCDYSPRMIAAAQLRAEEANLPIRFEVADLYDLHYPENAFDYLLLPNFVYSYLHPRKRRVQFLERALSILKPGGVFIVSFHREPQGGSLRRGAFNSWLFKLSRRRPFNREYEPGDLMHSAFGHFFEPEELRREVEEADFVIKEWLWDETFVVLAKPTADEARSSR